MPSEQELRQAPNLEAILDWVDARRPDVARDVRDIASQAWRREGSGEALLFLLTIGFAAGRKYQAEHPTLNADHSEYHR